MLTRIQEWMFLGSQTTCFSQNAQIMSFLMVGIYVFQFSLPICTLKKSVLMKDPMYMKTVVLVITV